MSIFSPQGRLVGLPKSSWFHQLPIRPIPCASSRPGAAASMNGANRSPARRTTTQPASVPSRIPPQTPSPPCQTSKIPFHFGDGTSGQEVMSW